MRGVRESPFSDVQSLEEGAGKCRKRCSECASAGRFVRSSRYATGYGLDCVVPAIAEHRDLALSAGVK